MKSNIGSIITSLLELKCTYCLDKNHKCNKTQAYTDHAYDQILQLALLKILFIGDCHFLGCNNFIHHWTPFSF